MYSKHMQEKIIEVLQAVEPKSKALPYLELDSMMLSQVVEVAQMVSQNDISHTHIQNWIKRKYLSNPDKKKYHREQVANILLINDLRNILSLEEISRLLGFVNETLADNSDDRINPIKLYRYYSEIFDRTRIDWQKSLEQLAREAEESLEGEEMDDADKEIVATTLVLLNLLARANLYQRIAELWLSGLPADKIKE
ncbi:MAG: DUF1836 domain-containing protein [Desulfitobacteriaceae bacterium]